MSQKSIQRRYLIFDLMHVDHTRANVKIESCAFPFIGKITCDYAYIFISVCVFAGMNNLLMQLIGPVFVYFFTLQIHFSPQTCIQISWCLRRVASITNVSSKNVFL